MFDTSSLNDMQQKAVEHFKGPLLILAGAGSGKTRVITHRISHLIENHGIKPWNILALTFTNKAAGEMKSRVFDTVGPDAAYITVSTFHSLCVRILRRHAEHLGYTNSFTIYDSDDQRSLMRRVIKDLNLDPKKYRERTFLSVISNAKDELLTPYGFEKRSEGDYSAKNYVKAYYLYTERLKEANAMDFDDLILKTVELFNTNQDVLSFYRDRYAYILVDEYQDTNHAQFTLIKLLASHTNESGETEHNLCVVGDDDQSIYKFRGADIRNILEFENEFPDTNVIKLEQNYRSTSNILDAANAVIKNNFGRKDKRLWTSSESGDNLYYKLFTNDREEAFGIAESIDKGVKNGFASYSDFAVLYRTNAQSRTIEEALVRLSIPYKVVGGVNFYQRKEIKDILAYLRLIDNSTDTVSLNRIINVPKRGIGNTSVEKITAYANDNNLTVYDTMLDIDLVPNVSRAKAKVTDFVKIIEDFKESVREEQLSIHELITTIIDVTGYETYLKDDNELTFEDRLENIDQLIAKAKDYEENAEVPTLSDFLAELALISDLDNVEDNTDIVLLMTLHSAKGLEFPYVFIPGMENDLFPSYMALNPDDYSSGADELEEERRLAYVGITRAKKKLSLSSCICRFKNGDYVYNKPSLFISEIPFHLLTSTKSTLMPFGDEIEKQEFHKSPGRYNEVDTSPRKTFRFTESKKPKTIINTPNLIKNSYTPVSKGTKNVSYKIGDKVRHQKFGEGVVKNIMPKGNDIIITVDFYNDITRKMVASLSPLEIIK